MGPVLKAIAPGASRRLVRDQRGQTTIFLALSMMVLVLFLAFMVNVGQMVHDRILTQVVADACALSAANVQAVGLNEVADLNWECQTLLDELQNALKLQFWDDSVNDMIDYYDSWMEINREMQQIMLKVFPALSHLAVLNTVSWYNKKYGRKFSAIPLIHPKYPGFSLCPVEAYDVNLFWIQHYPCSIPCPPLPVFNFVGIRLTIIPPIGPIPKTGIPIPQTRVISGRTRKDVNVETYYRVMVTGQTHPALINMKRWGFDVEVPEMVAFALAMPTGGSIDNLDPSYFARLVPLKTQFNFDLPYLPFRFKFRH